MISVTLAKVLASKTELGKGRNVQLLLTCNLSKKQNKQTNEQNIHSNRPMGIVFKIKSLSFRQNNPTCVFYNAKIKNAHAT